MFGVIWNLKVSISFLEKNFDLNKFPIFFIGYNSACITFSDYVIKIENGWKIFLTYRIICCV